MGALISAVFLGVGVAVIYLSAVNHASLGVMAGVVLAVIGILGLDRKRR